MSRDTWTFKLPLRKPVRSFDLQTGHLGIAGYGVLAALGLCMPVPVPGHR